MESQKLQFLKELLSKNKTIALIADRELVVIWCNKSELEEKVLGCRLDVVVAHTLSPPISEEVFSQVYFERQQYALRIVPVEEVVGSGGSPDWYWCELSADKVDFIAHNRIIMDRLFTFTSAFRQPIFGIVNSATALHAALEKAEMYEDIEKINQLVRNCYKMLRLLMNWSEMLRYSCTESEPKCTNLTKLFTDVCSVCATLMRSTDNEFVFEAADRDIITVLDPDRFLVVLMNLISNSLSYTVEPAVIKASLKLLGNDIVLTVSDNGCGISAKNLERVFDPFFSVEPNYSSSENIGLGLSIAKTFADKMGGTILISSKENEGTTITLRFSHKEDTDAPPYLESKTADYITNRFSPIYVALTDLCNLKFY